MALRRTARGTGRHRVPDPPAPAVRCGQGSHRGRCRDLDRGGRHGSGGYRLVQAQLRGPSRTGAVGIAAAVDALARTVFAFAAAYLAPAVVILAVVIPVVPDLVPAVLVLAVADLVLTLASAVALAFAVTVAFTLAFALSFRVPVVPVILATAIVLTAIIVAAAIVLTATVVPAIVLTAAAVVAAAIIVAAADRLVLAVGARPASHLVMSLPRRTTGPTGARRARAGLAGRGAWRCCRGAGRRT